LSERRTELSGERKRVAELAQSLVTEQGRVVTLEERIRAMEAEHESRAAQWAKGAADITDMRAERDALAANAGEHRGATDLTAAKLAAAERRIAELEASLRRDQDGTDGAGDQSRAATAELQRRIEEVAEEIMRVSEAGIEEEPQRSRSTG
jgi:chromosome segregation ATPase